MTQKFKMLLVIGFLITTTSSAQKDTSDKKALYQVIEDFRISIIKHDNADKFYDLFLNDSIAWAAIPTGKTKEEMEKIRPNFKIYSSNFKQFYKMISSVNIPEEKFYKIEISVRDEFATISFNYSFNIDSKIVNWGTEYWALLLVEDTWKITSVTWTMNMQHHKECPFEGDTYFKLTK